MFDIALASEAFGTDTHTHTQFGGIYVHNLHTDTHILKYHTQFCKFHSDYNA